MQTANLLEFGTGGGGLYGQDRDVVLNNFRFVEHGFARMGPDKVTVVEQFAPQCMLAIDISVLDRVEDEPEMMTQYYPVGSLPANRLMELGFAEKVNPKNPGGYLPSADGELPATEGPYIILDQKTDIWVNSAYAQLMEEFKQLGISEGADSLTAYGIKALNGTQVHLGTKALPKSAKAEAEEKLTQQVKAARTILVPTQILSYPWHAEQKPAAQTAAAAKPKAAAAAKPKAAAQPAPAAATSAAPATGGASAAEVKAQIKAGGQDDKIAEYVVQALRGAVDKTLTKALIPSKLIGLMSKEGAYRTDLMQRANSDEFLQSRGEFVFDPATNTVVLLAD